MIVIGPLWQILLWEAVYAIPMWVWGLIAWGFLDMLGLYAITPYILAISIFAIGYLMAFKTKPKNEDIERWMNSTSYKISAWGMIGICTVFTLILAKAEATGRDGIGRFWASIDQMLIVTPIIFALPLLLVICVYSGKTEEQYKKPIEERETYYKYSRPIAIVLAIIIIAIIASQKA